MRFEKLLKYTFRCNVPNVLLLFIEKLRENMNYSHFENDKKMHSEFYAFKSQLISQPNDFQKIWFGKLMKLSFRRNVLQLSIIIHFKVTKENVNYSPLKQIAKKC